MRSMTGGAGGLVTAAGDEFDRTLRPCERLIILCRPAAAVQCLHRFHRQAVEHGAPKRPSGVQVCFNMLLTVSCYSATLCIHQVL
jgi:hypothetical protein